MSHFDEILSNLGYREKICLEDSSLWSMWSATATVGLDSVESFYLYLKNSCPLKEAHEKNKALWKRLSENKGYHLVLTPSSSLAERPERTRNVFNAHKVATTKQLLLEHVLKREDIKWNEVSSEKYFIDPDLKFVNGSLNIPGGKTIGDIQDKTSYKLSHDNKAIYGSSAATSYMLKWLKGEERGPKPKASIAILIADGGIGKTTLSRILCGKLRAQNQNTFPILIHSKQWRSMIQTLTMDEVWNRATKEALSGGSVDTNKSVLRPLIREGLFIIMFDGFDELCVRPESALNPKRIINELIELVTPEEEHQDEILSARILLTARKTFWESIKADIDTSKLEIFEIEAFSKNKRKRYFEQRFKNQENANTKLHAATTLASKVRGSFYENLPAEDESQDKISGVPFILDLIARHVEGLDKEDRESAGQDSVVSAQDPYTMTDPFVRLLEDVCQREVKRQNLKYTGEDGELHSIEPSKQFDIFQELFLAHQDGATIEELADHLQVLCEIPDDEECAAVTDRFKNHMLLTPTKSKDEQEKGEMEFGAHYEPIKVYFLARFLALGLRNATESDTKRIVSLLAKNSTGETQLLDLLKGQLEKLDKQELHEAMRHAVEIIRESKGNERRESGKTLFRLAQKLVSASGNEKLDRTLQLAELLSTPSGRTIFNGVILTGQVSSYDLRKTEFKQCQFVDVDFKNCQFSTNSIFSGCSFEGTLKFTTCDATNSIQMQKNLSCSNEAEYELARVFGEKPREELKLSFAKDALSRALNKFNGDYGFGTIQYRNRTHGFRPGNPYNQPVWDALQKKGVVEKHHISNVDGDGLHVSDDSDVRSDINFFFDNGSFQGRLKEVLNYLTRK